MSPVYLFSRLCLLSTSLLFAAVDLGGSSDLAVVVVSDVVASAAVTEASAIVAVVSIVVSVGGIAVKAVESSGCD